MKVRNQLLVLLCLLLLLVGFQSAQAAIVADSVSEFSATQSQDGWEYGYYATIGDSSSFTQMTLYDATGNSGSGWWEQTATQPLWTLLWPTIAP